MKPKPDVFEIFLPGAIWVLFLRCLTFPFLSTLVKYRADYRPKPKPSSPNSSNEDIRTTTTKMGYFGMMSKVWKTEGWKGLYKGLVPHITGTLILLPTHIFTSKLILSIAYVPSTMLTRFYILLSLSVAALIDLPIIITTQRAMTTPTMLPWSDISLARRTLLSPLERRSFLPWRLYYLPGVLTTRFVHLVVDYVSFLMGLQIISYPSSWWWRNPSWDVYDVLRYTERYLVTMVLMSVLCPLEVILVKLALQRLSEDEDEDSITTPLIVDDDLSSTSGSEASSLENHPRTAIVKIRDVDRSEAYTGMSDCMMKIEEEEGIITLYRAVWITFLFGNIKGM